MARIERIGQYTLQLLLTNKQNQRHPRLQDYPPPLPHSSHSWRSFIYDTEGCAA